MTRIISSRRRSRRSQPAQRLTVAPETTASPEEAAELRAIVLERSDPYPFAKDIDVCLQTLLKFIARVPMRARNMDHMREIVVPKARAYAPPEDRKQPIQKLTVAYETTATEEEADIARQLIIESGGLEPCARDHAICNQTALKFAAMLPMRPDSASVVRDALRAEARRAAKAAS